MKAIVCLGVVIGVLSAGCGSKPQKAAAQSTNEASAASSGNPITAPVDYLGAVAKAKKSATRAVDLASLNQAIQLFHATEDRFPQDLNELVQHHYIARIPAAPPGTRLAYDPRTGAVGFVRQ